MVVLAVLPQLPQEADLSVEIPVVRRDSAAIARGGEILARMEAEAGGRAQAPDGPAVDARPNGLRRVLDDRDAPIPHLGKYRAHGRRLAVEVHRDDRACPRGDRAGQLSSVQRKRALFGVDQNGPGAAQPDRGDSRMEGVGLRDHLGALCHAARAKRNGQRVGAAVETARVLDAEKGGEIRFEPVDLAGENVPSRQQHLGDLPHERGRILAELVTIVVARDVHRSHVTRPARRSARRRAAPRRHR